VQCLRFFRYFGAGFKLILTPQIAEHSFLGFSDCCMALKAVVVKRRRWDM
jgi:hypothetical protein